MHSLRVLKSSDFLPITVEEAKLFLKITAKEEDALVQRMIESASMSFESYTSKALLVKQWIATYNNVSSIELLLPVRHVQRINSINLITSCNARQALSAKSFCLIEDRVILRIGTFNDLVEICFEAGMAYEPQDIPSDIKEALLEHVAYMYEHRSSGQAFPLSRYNSFIEIKM